LDNGKPIAEKFSFAGLVRYCLGRGGDHVVIRNARRFSLFGRKKGS
jgi:c-di-AMP phosphodiesterase-like protein